MDEALERIFSEIWQSLSDATHAPSHPMRNVALASVDAHGAPHLRLLILRAVVTAAFRLQLHTDLRSAKWRQISSCAQVSLLTYDPEKRVQIRLSGQAELIGPDRKEQRAIWDGLPDWTRTTYCGGPPGHRAAPPTTSRRAEQAPDRDQTEHGRSVFGVLDISVTHIDWYTHPRGAIARAEFDCDPKTLNVSGRWLTP